MNYQPGVGALRNEAEEKPRHLGVVRITHWLIVAAVLGLLASGIAILVAHPRLYWGETGAVGTDSLVDLPIPFIIGLSPWNRPIHFFFAWMLVLSALTYVGGGWATQHLRKDLLPARTDLNWQSMIGVISAHLRWKRTSADEAWSYNVVQRLSYLGVVFVLFPGMVWTGLAMSPGVTAVFPVIATGVGGFQSVRTLHFVFATLLVVFVVVHIAMLFLVGFTSHVRAMITGRIPQKRSPP
jgi:thiosulfate reductase cytochrome b subunit